MLVVDPLSVPCPYCLAEPGDPCRTRAGAEDGWHDLDVVHITRKHRAQAWGEPP